MYTQNLEIEKDIFRIVQGINETAVVVDRMKQLLKLSVRGDLAKKGKTDQEILAVLDKETRYFTNWAFVKLNKTIEAEKLKLATKIGGQLLGIVWTFAFKDKVKAHIDQKLGTVLHKLYFYMNKIFQHVRTRYYINSYFFLIRPLRRKKNN